MEKLYLTIISGIKNSGFIDIQKLINSSDSIISKLSVDLIAQAHNISENWKERYNIRTGREDEKLYKTTEKAILSLKNGIVNLKISELQEQVILEKINAEGIKKLSELIKLKSKIAKHLGRNIG